MQTKFRALLGVSLALFAHEGYAQGYTKEIPAALLKQAKLTEAAAAATALKQVPGGAVKSVELEKEGGKLIYSYDIATVGKAGIDEVHIDAKTGAVVGAVVHENDKTEAKEKKDEAKEKKAEAKGKKVKTKGVESL